MMVGSKATLSTCLRASSSGSMIVLATPGQGYGWPLGAGGRRGRHGLGNQWGSDRHDLFVSSIVRGVTVLNRNDGVGGDGWESNPPRTPHSLHSQPAYFSPEKALALTERCSAGGPTQAFRRTGTPKRWVVYRGCH